MTKANKAFLEDVINILNSPTEPNSVALRELREYCGMVNRHHCGDCGLTTESWNSAKGCADCGCPEPNTIVVLKDKSRALTPELY